MGSATATRSLKLILVTGTDQSLLAATSDCNRDSDLQQTDNEFSEPTTDLLYPSCHLLSLVFRRCTTFRRVIEFLLLYHWCEHSDGWTSHPIPYFVTMQCCEVLLCHLCMLLLYNRSEPSGGWTSQDHDLFIYVFDEYNREVASGRRQMFIDCLLRCLTHKTRKEIVRSILCVH